MTHHHYLRKTIFVFSIAISILFPRASLYSQDLKIDINFGIGAALIDFPHNEYNLIYDKPTGGGTGTFYVGISQKLKQNFYLRTEFGLRRTDFNLRMDYQYEEFSISGFELKNAVVSMGFSNTKLYVGLLPEYRYSYKNIDFFINGGILVATDLFYIFDFGDPGTGNDFDYKAVDSVQDGTGGFFGFATNVGLVYNIKNIGIKLSSGYKNYETTKFYKYGHPEIQQKNWQVDLGIVYHL